MFPLKQKTFLIIAVAVLAGTISYTYSVTRVRADNFYSLQNTPHACSTQAECNALNAGGPDSTGKLNSQNAPAASSPGQSNAGSSQTPDSSQQNCLPAGATANMGNFNEPPCPDNTSQSGQDSSQSSQSSNQTQSSDSGNQMGNMDAMAIPSNQWGNSGTDQSASSVFDDKYSPMAVPLISQPTAITCGPTSLTMEASYWGVNLPTSEIISDTNMTNTGTTLSDLETTAKKIGLTVVSDNLSITSSIGNFFTGSNDLANLTTNVNNGYPAIVNVDLSPYSGGHAIVVTGITDNAVYVNNPAGNGSQQVYSKSDFIAMWSAKGSEYIALGPPKK
jgi:uncharacterized protein YvpB